MRYLTWYYRYADRWGERASQRYELLPARQIQGILFYLLIPGLVGAAAYIFLYVTGLNRAFSDGYFPSFISTKNISVLAHGAMTFAVPVIAAAFLYWTVGVLFVMADELKPPKYQNKNHLWKDRDSD